MYEYISFITSFVQTMQILIGQLSPYTAISTLYPKPATVYNGQRFDYIIVGAGSAGCVLANRLTETGCTTVLLVEAGDYPNLLSDVPGLYGLEKNSPVDWNYTSVNDGFTSQSLKNHNVHETRGKVVGGSSNLNYMFYVRGNKADFDKWVALGNEGWDWDNVTYYFKKSERLNDSLIMKGSSAGLHGYEGYLGVTRPEFSKVTNPYAEALRENGRNILTDTNGYNQIGYSAPQYTINEGLRQSTAVSFIRPIKNRPNLFILTNTLARKVIINNDKVAVGVEVKLLDGKVLSLKANKEVILSAGAINSPQLLMLSGIGPRKHLEDMRIPVILDSPLVGRNLQDHSVFFNVLKSHKTVSPSMSNPIVDSFVYPGPVLLGHIALNKSQTYPDYQSYLYFFPKGSLQPIILCSISIGLNDKICDAISKVSRKTDTVYVVIINLHPKSRGSIKLKSKNPDDYPLIELGYFSDLNDLDADVSYLEDFLTVLNTTYFRSTKTSVVDMKVSRCKNFVFGSREYWKCFVLNTVATQYHVSGTCAMGREGEGVVDARLRVRGIQRLRVVDGSIMPLIVSGNLNAPIIMIAEKASDMIQDDNCGNI